MMSLLFLLLLIRYGDLGLRNDDDDGDEKIKYAIDTSRRLLYSGIRMVKKKVVGYCSSVCVCVYLCLSFGPEVAVGCMMRMGGDYLGVEWVHVLWWWMDGEKSFQRIIIIIIVENETTSWIFHYISTRMTIFGLSLLGGVFIGRMSSKLAARQPSPMLQRQHSGLHQTVSRQA